MKKIVCFMFLMLILIVNFAFQRGDDDVLDLLKNAISITVITNDSCKIDGVNNGNKKMIVIDKISQIDNIPWVGITCIIDLDLFNVREIIDMYNIHIDSKYLVNGNIVYDCYLNNLGNGVVKTMQIVQKGDVVIVGIPAILNDF